MRRFTHALSMTLTVLLIVMLIPAPAYAAEHWAREHLDALVSRGLTDAAEYRGRLDDTLTCTEAAELLCRALNLTDGNYLDFVLRETGDAAPSEGGVSRERYMWWAAVLGNVSGVGASYADSSVKAFADHTEIGERYYGGVAQLTGNFIVSGTGSGYLMPKRDITAAEAVTLIAKILKAERLPYENPRGIVITQPEAQYRITTASHMSILGACDYEYPLYMNGKEIPTTARGFFAAYVDLKDGENAFTFTNNGKEETVVITRKAPAGSAAPEAVYYDKPIYGVIKLNSVSHRAEPDEDPNLLTPLAYGTTFKLLGEIGDYYIIADGTYIYKSAIDAFEGEVSDAVITGAQIISGKGFTNIIFDLNVNTLYSLERTGGKAVLTLHAVKDNSHPDPAGSLITSIVKTPGNGAFTYDIEFGEAPVGHYVEFKDGKMIVGFRHAAKSLSDAKVVLDAGHGGADPGALGPPGDGGPMEKDFNLYVANAAKEYLESRGASVLLTRSGDTSVSLAERTAAILDYKPDISVSVHTNSMPVSSDYRTAQGPEMYFTFNASKAAAESVYRYITGSLGSPYREPVRSNLALTRLSVCPAILLEMSFICGPDDYEWLLVKDNLDRMGEALGRGIEEYLTSVMGEAFTSVSTGAIHAAALKADGGLWTWGGNEYGQLGDGTTENRTTPYKLMDCVASVSCGNWHTAAVTANGELWVWGDNLWGQLGVSETSCSADPIKVMDGVAAVSSGEDRTLALKTDGSLWGFGGGGWGYLGDGTEMPEDSAPVKLMEGIASVSTSGDHTLAVGTDGSLWAWGWNGYGSVGDGSTDDRAVPTKIMDGVVSASAGGGCSMAVKQDGSLWAWGWNNSGRLGDGSDIGRPAPVKIMDGVASVTAGYGNAMAIKTDGSLWAWGIDYGKTPVKTDDNVSAVSLSGRSLEGKDGQTVTLQTMAIIKNGGELWMWGYNGGGQLGSGTTDDQALPVRVGGK